MKIELWDDKLAVRIPEEMATAFRLQEGDEISIIVKRSWLHLKQARNFARNVLCRSIRELT